MSLNSVQPVQPHQKSGGLFGSIASLAGDAVGLAAAPFTGGASLAIAPAIGNAVGMTDAALNTPKQAGMSQTIPTENSPPPAMNAMNMHPEVQLATVLDAKKAINESGNIPGPVADQYHSILDSAASRLRTQVGANS